MPSALAASIDTAEKAIQHLKEVEEDLGQLRIDVEGILANSQDTAEALRPELVEIKSQIEKLGPSPAKDAPAEAPAIAAERARLARSRSYGRRHQVDRAHLGPGASADRDASR